MMKLNLLLSDDVKSRHWEEAENKLLDGVRNGRVGFGWIDLPIRPLEDMAIFAEKLALFPSVVLVGIGGSSLGLETVLRALDDQQGRGSRVFVADNLDSRQNEKIWQCLEPKETAVCVVSKSGRTLETLGNMTWFLCRMEESLGEEQALKHLFVVTDPKEGLLRQWVDDHHVESLALPSDVGGRFSVLSSAALPVIAAAGRDWQGLIQGAAAMREDIISGGASRDAVRALAGALLDGYDSRRAITVFMPYGNALGAVGPWFCQLWAESLGKEGQGFTPQSVLGTIDQHSQLQLYAEGPDDKFFLFLRREDHGSACFELPSRWGFGIEFLNGLPLDEAMDHELSGVVASLRRRGRPCAVFSLEHFDAFSLGGLLFFLQWLTGLAGFVMGIDPFNQPGVEEGKNFALALCGDKKWEHLKGDLSRLACPTVKFQL